MSPTRTDRYERMTLKIRINEKTIEIEAEPDDCSFYTILNDYPEKEELKKFDRFTLDTGTEKIPGRVIKGNMHFNDMSTTGNIIFVENYPTNIIGWHQLKDMGLLKANKNRQHVVDVPPVVISDEAKPGYAQEGYLKWHLIGDAKTVIASWVRRGIIERCSSDYNSSVRLALKPNEKVKIIFDYSHLNSCIIPMPSRWELDRHKVIASVPLGNFYSVIKLYYGEWQIPLDTNSKYKTAFTFLGQQYVWNRLPGKFRNKNAILSKTLGQILNKLPQNVRKHVSYFVDKMLISADTKKECGHFTNLLRSHLKDNGFEMQETDTDDQICLPQVEYLGREVFPEGIRLGESYLQKVQKIGPPRSAKGLKSILATLEDARRFTSGFGVYTADLYKLLNKTEIWSWRGRHQSLLNALIRQILKNRSVVPGLREGDPCIVQVFVIPNDSWMAEVFNAAGKRYLSASGTIKPVKKQETLGMKELKAMKEAWKTISSEMKGREIIWEVESPEVEDPSSVELHKSLDLSCLTPPQHKIKVVPSSGRLLPIKWPVHV
ncbi:uncharacterized protein LOC120945908 [Rana temporaria]|uniref:uncharacterized protein LOC120945908 n=1 Tax=Rana temporaria TaxID=8407 RepID=UPI001AACB3B8|nr:uncharacterized protein LOC120945908 [Rana temporaria]